ncbi:hypothetical protein J1C67_00955 [Clostridium gasigenes]|uniref:hypothetical protein n=1 Tax=Clostridium gasigenes TaxID=94869 RepID=UPI0014382842|nr:hypothetical protein [Clostridium gasigenes]NKF06933.1 hypothetical protein [Clostridium gasigenes]QSW19804.1 hypothetical protein J1C67_00955 [Clostridium gasigenes]
MNEVKQDEGFIMDLWEKIFFLLSKISVFEVIRIFVWNRVKNKFRFVEIWVVTNLGLSITLSLLIYNLDNNVINWIAFIYAILRVFEIIIYQINVIIFDPYRCEKKGVTYKVKSIPRILVLLIHNYVEIIFWYSVMVISIIRINNFEIIYSWLYFVKASFLCIATFNGDLIVNNGKFLNNIVFVETFSGIVLTIVSIARFVGILPAVEEMK